MSTESAATSSAGLEKRAQELVSIVFTLCEKHLLAHASKPSPEHLALTASAMTLQKAITTFLAVEKLCE